MYQLSGIIFLRDCSILMPLKVLMPIDNSLHIFVAPLAMLLSQSQQSCRELDPLVSISTVGVLSMRT